MPYMTEASRPDPVVSFQETPEPASGAPGAMRYSIKRVGARPLSFEGVELGMAMSFDPDQPYWYEFNLFRKTEGFVLTIKRFHVSESETDFCRAWEFDTADEAIAALEGYDAGQDVRAERYIPGPAAGAAELAAAALQLRAEIAESRAHFASLAGEFLYDLDEAV